MIPKEHQSKLTDDCVEGLVLERQGLGRSCPPFDGWGEPLRDGEHPGNNVETSDGTIGTDTHGGFPSQYSGATGDIQHSIAGADPGGIYNFGSPLLKQGWDMEMLVRVRGSNLFLGRSLVRILRLRHLTGTNVGVGLRATPVTLQGYPWWLRHDGGGEIIGVSTFESRRSR